MTYLVHHSGEVREFADILDAMPFARLHWPARVTREDGTLLAEVQGELTTHAIDGWSGWFTSPAVSPNWWVDVAQSVGWN